MSTRHADARADAQTRIVSALAQSSSGVLPADRLRRLSGLSETGTRVAVEALLRAGKLRRVGDDSYCVAGQLA